MLHRVLGVTCLLDSLDNVSHDNLHNIWTYVKVISEYIE